MIGTLPTGDINSQARPGPAGEGHLVIFDSGMFLFADKIAAIAAQALDARRHSSDFVILDEPGIVDRLNRIPGIRVQFADLIFCYVVLGGDPAYGLAYPPPPPNRAAAGDWSETVLAFVVAHEYAHVILGHRGIHAADGSGLGQEIEADQLGLELARHMTGSDVVAYLGACLFLLGSKSLDIAARQYHGPSSGEVRSQPPPTERLAGLVQTLAVRPEAAYAGEVGRRLTRAIGGLSGSLNTVFATAGHPPPGWRPSSEMEQHAALLAFLAVPD